MEDPLTIGTWGVYATRSCHHVAVANWAGPQNMISSPGRSPIWSRLVTSAGVALDHVTLEGDLGKPDFDDGLADSSRWPSRHESKLNLCLWGSLLG